MRYTELGHTGMKISSLSFGASSLGSVFRETNEKESFAAVETAIEGGINFIDVSPYYGLYSFNELLPNVATGDKKPSFGGQKTGVRHSLGDIWGTKLGKNLQTNNT